MDQDCWIKLNKLLNSEKANNLEISKLKRIFKDTERINKEVPFCFIQNYESTFKRLCDMPLWISYGGRRTGSTFIYNLLRIIMSSLTTRFICGWEGDYASPIKFYETFANNNFLLSGILKIHRYEEDMPILLDNDKALAIISIRDYSNKIKSWWRMINNSKSPFYKKNLNESHIIKFIDQEIEEEIKKRKLKNSLFIREDFIKNNTDKAISFVTDFLQVEIHDYSKRLIADKLRKKNVIGDRFQIKTNSTGHDSNTFFHHGHINPDYVYGKEYDFIDKLLNDKYRDFMDIDGYLK